VYLIVLRVAHLFTNLLPNSIPDVDGLPLPKRNILPFFHSMGAALGELALMSNSIPGAIKRYDDSSFGMKRTEIVCANCGGHLVASHSRFSPVLFPDGTLMAYFRVMCSGEKDIVRQMETRSMNDIV